MIAPTAMVHNPEAELALERVLRGRVFAKAERSRRFLRYLVEAALAQPPVAVKEYTVAMDVFDREPSYDPAIDATVRVEASRLRARLREYYDEEGREDPWVIEVPKGRYAAVLRRRVVSDGAADAAEGREIGDGAGLGVPGQDKQRGRRWPRVAWVVCLMVLAGVLAGWEWHARRAHPPALATPTSLAILPIVNRTGDAGMDYLCDGLTDDLIRQLSQVPALKLIARTSVFRYRQATADPRAIGRGLGVGAVMTGELRRRPEHLALTVELSNTSDGSVLLDREYIVEGNDVRTVQADVQRDLIAKLHVESSALDPGRSLRSVTTSPPAYQEFLQGDTLARNGAPEDLHQALAHFERAVALDPGFDLAWSALASEHLLLGLYFEPPREHMPLAREFAKKALQINPSLGDAHGSLGLIELVYDWNPAAAEAEMTSAGAEEAAISTLACTAHLIERAGKPRTAEAMLGRMLTYDPQSAGLIAELGCVDYYRGDYQAALRHYREAMAADPRSPVPYWGMGKSLNAEGRYGEAVAELRTFKQRNGFEPPLLTAEIGYALAAAGKKHEALGVIHELGERGRASFVDPYLVAVVYASMHDREATFAWLDKALEVRSPFMISLLTEPKWEPLRSDPRFAGVVERMMRSKAA